MPKRALQALRLHPSTAFLLRAVAWIALFFGLLRSPWVLDYVLLPFAGLQHRIACDLTGAPRGAVVVDQSCTGADAMALCVGVILAFPASWRLRLAGCGAGLALLSLLNMVRIGHLSLVAGSESFRLLHVFIWPALLIVAAAGFVFLWMVLASRRREGVPGLLPPGRTGGAFTRFALLTLVLVAVFYAFFERLLASRVLEAAAGWVAATAGVVMRGVGLEAAVSGGLLRTANGSWAVTPECVLTPMIPVYLAAVLAAPIGRWRRLGALLATVPLFLLLGIARLLVLGLPPALVGSHLVAVHGFYQLLAALLAVVLLAWLYRGRRETASRVAARALGALVLGALIGVLVGQIDLRWLRPAVAALGEGLHLGHGWRDGQGVLTTLPGFTLGLFCAALLAARRRPRPRKLAVGLAWLAAGQMATLIGVSELAAHLNLEPPVALLRAWALILPLWVGWAVFRRRGAPAAAKGEGLAAAAGAR